MMRVIFSLACLLFNAIAVFSQATTEELEKQRKQLKKEIEETQNLLNSNKAVTKQNLTTLSIMSNKLNLQDRVVENIDKDLHILDNNIYTIQKDVNKYDRLLDTLKLEYAKSMVYAYKNRGNYEFMNFIFAANNFNDAIKRIAYLKSYRQYREMQGQNILRTQELRKKRLLDLGGSKQKKKTTLEIQKDEMDALAAQKAEQDKIVIQLKKEGNDLGSRIAARQKQLTKVNKAVKDAIAKAIKEENDRRLAAEKAAKLKRDALALEAKRLKAEEDKKATAKVAAANALAAANAKAAGKPAPEAIKEPVVVRTTKPVKEVVEPEAVTFNTESVALSNSFERNKGSLPWPVDNGAVLMHFGPNKLPSGANFQNSSLTISSKIGTNVKAVFDGIIMLVFEVEDGKFSVSVKHGTFYTTYSNLTNVSVKKDQEIKTGQVLGKVAPNLDGLGAIDFYSAKGYTDLDPEKWLRRR